MPKRKEKFYNKDFVLSDIGEKFLEHLFAACRSGYVLGRTVGNVSGRYTPFWKEMAAERERFSREAEKRRIIYELKRRRLVEEAKVGNKLIFQLTDKGEAALLRRAVFACHNELPKEQFCIVIFDIPESQRYVRNMFRRFLKEAGFKQLQKSVWMTNKNVVGGLKDFIASIQAEKWINILVANTVLLNEGRKR